jgi:hypothetical protein
MVFLFKFMGIIPIEKLELIITMVWLKLIKDIDFAISIMFLFLPNNINKCIHTLFLLEKIIIELICYLFSKQNLEVVFN